MKLSLNMANLGKERVGLDGQVELAAKHGFAGVDLGMGGVMAKFGDENASAARDWFAQNDVLPAVFGLECEWRKDEEAFQNGLANVRKHAHYANQLGVTRCTTWMPTATNGDVGEWHKQTSRRFGEIAKILGDGGVRFGLEWVGPHHLRADGSNPMGANDWIHDLPGTMALIDDIGQSNVGLLVDSYHCYTTGVSAQTLAGLGNDQIVHVHINDTLASPEAAIDGQRVLPGLGRIDLPAFLRGLRATGYDGFVACEILAPQPLAETADEGAGRIRESLRALGL